MMLLQFAQHEWDESRSINTTTQLASNIGAPIDPTILQEEEQFKIQHGSQSQLQIQVVDEQEDRSEEKEEEGSDIMVSPPRSVISIDSIGENTDFVTF